jgi:endonuclease YncB( thermonuclease family)
MKFFTTIALAFTAALSTVDAQEANDPEIESLEAAYRAELVSIRKDLGEKWLSALSNLKDQLTREKKFAEALLVRNEEERVKALLESDPLPVGGVAPVTKIRLEPLVASQEGGLRPGADGVSLGFQSVGASASWELPPDLIPGTYEVIVHFQAGTAGGGSFRVDIGDDQQLDGEIVPTPRSEGSWKTKRSTLVGECVLDEFSGVLSLTSTEHDGEALMNLTGIDLAPPGTWAEMQAQIEATAPGRPTAVPSEFEKLEGARWIDKDTRKSGEFVVSHEGKEHTFRLYFVELPPTETPTSRIAKAVLARTARMLRTSEDKLLHFGRKVDEGLRDALWTEDLTIYTRWESRGRKGYHFAYILVGDEPMSLSLIKKGQARTGGSYATETPFIEPKKGSAKTFVRQLREAESAAKQSGEGLWGL